MGRIEKLLKYETAGDPMTGLKWTRRTTRKIAQELRSLGIAISRTTVGKLLRKLDYSLKVNHKKLSSGSGTDRDEQFTYIAKQREDFERRGVPIISVDVKKKELVGRFKNPGVAWKRESERVLDHDFPSLSDGKAVPYGVYDIQANRGSIFVGVSSDTADFAVASIEKWWRCEGQERYLGAEELLILADSGGSNAARNRAWKAALQSKLADRHRVSVSVCHYPAGASKWNPIDHRLFSEVSKNWSGKPLENYETILKYIRTTTTTTGLRVQAFLDRRRYPKGKKISNAQMRMLAIEPHETLPLLNYTLNPR